MWGEWLRRACPPSLWLERWHVAALLVAAAILLLPRGGGAAGRRDGWRVEQQRLAHRLARAAEVDHDTLLRRVAEQPSLAWRVALVSWGGVAVLGLGGVLLWQAVRRRRRGQPAVPWRLAEGGPPNAPWMVWDVVKLMAWVVCGTQFLHFALAFLLRAAGVRGVDRHLAAAIGTLLVDGLAIALVGLLLLRPYHAAWRTVGFRGEALGRQVRVGLWGYVVWVPLLVATATLVMAIVRGLRLEPEPQAVVAMLFEESRPGLLGLLWGLIAVLGPAAEELIFRGVTYTALRRRWGVGVALAGSAGFFAALHADPFAFGPILVLGFWLGWLYERTGSLVPSLTVHIVHNTVMLFITLTTRDVLRLASGGTS